MRVFISYASEQNEIAEAVAIGLRQSGHRVFFDRDTLPSGEEYDIKIQKEIEGSDLFIFLISPTSVEAGRYTLSELRFARKKWPSPSGKVLPVLVEETPLNDVPQCHLATGLSEPRSIRPTRSAWT